MSAVNVTALTGPASATRSTPPRAVAAHTGFDAALAEAQHEPATAAPTTATHRTEQRDLPQHGRDPRHATKQSSARTPATRRSGQAHPDGTQAAQAQQAVVSSAPPRSAAHVEPARTTAVSGAGGVVDGQPGTSARGDLDEATPVGAGAATAAGSGATTPATAAPLTGTADAPLLTGSAPASQVSAQAGAQQSPQASAQPASRASANADTASAGQPTATITVTSAVLARTAGDQPAAAEPAADRDLATLASTTPQQTADAASAALQRGSTDAGPDADRVPPGATAGDPRSHRADTAAGSVPAQVLPQDATATTGSQGTAAGDDKPSEQQDQHQDQPGAAPRAHGTAAQQQQPGAQVAYSALESRLPHADGATAGVAPAAAAQADAEAPASQALPAGTLQQATSADHSVRVQVQTDALGRVTADLHTRPGELAVHLSVPDDTGRALMAQRMDALRDSLGQSGTAVHLSLTAHGAAGSPASHSDGQQGSTPREDRATQQTAPFAPQPHDAANPRATDGSPVLPAPADSTRLVDVRA